MTPTPIWRDPPLGLACRLTGMPVSAAAAQTGSHIWCSTGSGATDPVEDDARGHAELRHPHQLRDGLLGASAHGSGRSMMNRPFDSS